MGLLGLNTTSFTVERLCLWTGRHCLTVHALTLSNTAKMCTHFYFCCLILYIYVPIKRERAYLHSRIWYFSIVIEIKNIVIQMKESWNCNNKLCYYKYLPVSVCRWSWKFRLNHSWRARDGWTQNILFQFSLFFSAQTTHCLKTVLAIKTNCWVS